MDLQQALKYPFDNDPQWLKKTAVTAVPVGIATIGSFATNFGNNTMRADDEQQLLGVVILLLGLTMQFVAGLFVSGYMLKAVRHVLHDAPLPEWDDMGRLVKDGFRVYALTLGYYAPVAVIMMIALGAFIAVMLSGSIALSQNSSDDLLALFAVGGVAAYVVGGLLFILLVAAVNLFAVPAYLTLVREDSSVGECFQFGRIWKIVSSNFTSILLFGLCYLAVGVISMLLTLFSCGLGIFVVKPFMIYVYAVLYAQLARIIMPAAVDEVRSAYEFYE